MLLTLWLICWLSFKFLRSIRTSITSNNDRLGVLELVICFVCCVYVCLFQRLFKPLNVLFNAHIISNAKTQIQTIHYKP